MAIPDIVLACNCDLFEWDKDYCYVRGTDENILALIETLQELNFEPEVNRGCDNLTVIRF
jgi:hypothetical protein